MIMNSYPFDSIPSTDEHGDPIYDRAVSSQFLQELGRKDRSYGVIALNNLGDMLVSAGSTGLTVTVNNGYCFIRGCYGWYNEPQTLELAPAVNNDRIDAIVLRLNTAMSVRGIELVVKQGEEAAKPTAPSMNRTGTIWELGLANVRIKKGAASVEAQYVEDTRANPLRCGISTPMQEIDTSMLYNQIQDQVTKNLELIQHAIDDTEAGHLQSQIDTINAKFPPINTTLTQLDTKITQTNNRFTGVESRELIWENASPSSAFSAQTIVVDLSDYDFYMIEIRNENNMFTTQRVIGKVEVGFGIYPTFSYANDSVTGKLVTYSRNMSQVANGLKVDTGHIITANEIRNGGSVIIPLRIWGVKEA